MMKSTYGSYSHIQISVTNLPNILWGIHLKFVYSKHHDDFSGDTSSEDEDATREVVGARIIVPNVMEANDIQVY